MRYDILKLQFSHTLSMRGATLPLLGNYTNHGIQPIYTIHLKLGEIVVDIHTYKLCKIEIYVLLNFWFLHMLKYLIFVIAQKGQL